ncbi:MAG: protein kinase [Anaerolineaceae bacterium]|nr:protein kinase [Anaerolineaceae bacterium]
MIQENQLIGRYLVLQEKNGILVARDTRSDWLVQLVKLPRHWGGQKDAFKILVQDLQPAINLQHESAQSVDDAFEHKGSYYLALRFVEAAPLEKILKELKALSVVEIQRLAHQVGGAVQQLHMLAGVHGNLGQQNILVDKDGNYILSGLSDLPLSRYNKKPLKYKAGSAPELLKGEAPSFASDQYSLAKLLKTLIERAKKQDDFKKSDLPQGLSDALDKALSKAPDSRYKDMHAFIRAFNGAIQANKNHANAGRANTGSNARKQDLKMDYSEIPPSYFSSGTLTSGAESALSQAISGAAGDQAFFEGTGFMPADYAEQAAPARASNANPYPMWAGASPQASMSGQTTVRVGAGKPSIVVEDYAAGPAKSHGSDKDLSMRNIPKYKPAYDVDLSEASKSADIPFAVDDEAAISGARKERVSTFLLALGMVALILVAVTAALLGGNTPQFKLPGSKDVSANVLFNGAVQSTLAKGEFPAATLEMNSVVAKAAQFPHVQTSTYDGKGGGLTLSATPTATITVTPSAAIEGAFAVAPTGQGFYWDLAMETPSQGATVGSNPVEAQPTPESIYWDVHIESEAARNTTATVLPEPNAEAPSGAQAKLMNANPSPEPFYWDIAIEFPSTPVVNIPGATPMPDAGTENTAGEYLQTQVAAALSTKAQPSPSPTATPTSVPTEVPQPTSSAQGGIWPGYAFMPLPTPESTPVPMKAGSEGSSSELKVSPSHKTELMVQVLDNFGKPLADKEVMVLPSTTWQPGLQTPIQIAATPEYIVPKLPIPVMDNGRFGGQSAKTDLNGQIIFDLDPGSFQVVYVSSNISEQKDSLVHYEVEVASGSKTELTLHRDLVTVNLVNVDGEKVNLPGLGLMRKEEVESASVSGQKPRVILLQPASTFAENQQTGLGSGGSGQMTELYFDLTPGIFELVQIDAQSGQQVNPLGLTLDLAQGHTQSVAIELGRLVLPASFLEEHGKAGDLMRVIAQSELEHGTAQRSTAAASQVYNGEAVVKLDLLPGTYALEWGGTLIENIVIRANESADVYFGHKGGK